MGEKIHLNKKKKENNRDITINLSLHNPQISVCADFLLIDVDYTKVYRVTGRLSRKGKVALVLFLVLFFCCFQQHTSGKISRETGCPCLPIQH